MAIKSSGEKTSIMLYVLNAIVTVDIYHSIFELRTHQILLGFD